MSTTDSNDKDASVYTLTSFTIPGLESALCAVNDEDDYRLWLIEVGFFDLDSDPTTPFDSVEVVVAGESPAMLGSEACDVALEAKAVPAGTHVSVINESIEFDVTDVSDIDLFGFIKLLPEPVQTILAAASDQHTKDDWDYKDCAALEEALKEVGYSMDYYLDRVPFDLKKIQPVV